MKTREDIEATLRKNIPFLKEKYNVDKIGIFGSYIRGEESKESDIDILVDFENPIGWEFIDLKEFLEEILNKKVDLVTVKALKPRLRENILKEVVYAWKKT
ncbi:MAG: nucleotidyltransferase family protein [Spirochaetes bacterium]|nr:nucleotidyltransferase family protein [Spirochaetota bacterium]